MSYVTDISSMRDSQTIATLRNTSFEAIIAVEKRRLMDSILYFPLVLTIQFTINAMLTTAAIEIRSLRTKLQLFIQTNLGGKIS